MNNNENTNTIQEEWYWIDYLRVFATFGVILLHTAAPLANQYGIVSNYDWWTGNIYNSISFLSRKTLMLFHSGSKAFQNKK